MDNASNIPGLYIGDKFIFGFGDKEAEDQYNKNQESINAELGKESNVSTIVVFIVIIIALISGIFVIIK